MSRLRYRTYDQPISPAPVDRKIYTPLEYRDPALYTFVSRYSRTRLVPKDSAWVHESVYEINIPETSDDQYYTVTVATANRLDLISNIYYSFPIYWWVIAAANQIIDSFTVPVGTVLRIPPLSSLYTNKGIFAANAITPNSLKEG